MSNSSTSETGLSTLTDKVFSPAGPVRTRSANLATPSVAGTCLVPVRVVPAVALSIVTIGFPVVTRFWSWSKIRTTISLMTSALALPVEESSKFREEATPWSRRRV